MNKSSFDWKKYLVACLNSTEYCSLATVDKKGVWSNPVFFAWDDKFNLYFISQMHTRHMQNLKKDSRVAVSIYKTEQKGDVCGIQLEGKGKIITDTGEIKKAHEIYFERAEKGSDIESYINNPTWILVKIVPEHIYYLDTRFFGEERQVVPINKLK